MLNPFHSGYRLTGTLVNSEDPDEMPHLAAFHQGLLCLLRQNNLRRRIHCLSEILTRSPLKQNGQFHIHCINMYGIIQQNEEG